MLATSAIRRALGDTRGQRSGNIKRNNGIEKYDDERNGKNGAKKFYL